MASVDVSSFLRHIDSLHTMASRLAKMDIAIYEHAYQTLAFGSWSIMAGKRHERIRFSWDGRDAFLTVEQAAFPDSRQQTEWEFIKTEGINVRQHTEVFDAMESFLKLKFAA